MSGVRQQRISRDIDSYFTIYDYRDREKKEAKADIEELVFELEQMKKKLSDFLYEVEYVEEENLGGSILRIEVSFGFSDEKPCLKYKLRETVEGILDPETE